MAVDILPGRKKERVLLFLIATILLLLFIKLFFAGQQKFADVPKRLKDGSIVNLNAGSLGKNIKALLQKGYYFDDPRDVELVASVIGERTISGGNIDNIGELNKSKYDVLADEAFIIGGESFKKRVLASRALLGYAGDDSIRFVKERSNPPAIPASIDIGVGDHAIKGKVLVKGDPAGGVLVKLRMILPQDSIDNDETVDFTKTKIESAANFRKVYVQGNKKQFKLQQLTAFTRTDADGRFAFENLPEGKAFEVYPMQPGYQFGKAQGTEELTHNISLKFYKAPHKIRLIASKDFNRLKKDGSLIVRLPDQYNFWYWFIACSFIIAFVLIHLLLSFRFPLADQLILPVVMALTGISMLTLLNLQDPLSDRFLAKDTLVYLGIGFAGILALLFTNLRRFNADSPAYRLFIFKDGKAANGWPWVALAMFVLLFTIVVGSGPEGSGVKVNLLGFQPSEIVKFLIILFLAGFFAVNEKFISEYITGKKRWSFFSFSLVTTLLTLFLFLLLGDLGPAMVICFTFIILFSFSRGDFGTMAGFVIFFILVTWLLQNIWLSIGITALAIIGFTSVKRRKLSESSIMALVVIVAFLTIDKIYLLDKLFPGPVERLIERKAIWQDAWNNEVYGGDQIANGIWAMASGGVSGQGAEESFAKTIPEAHTDMILPSIGEVFGLMGIISIFLLFLLYLHRAIIIGRRAGAPFLFYLCSGIGIATFVQFLLIAGGSTGALPLSGVSLPFVSYGGSSLVINLWAAGFLLSASLVRGTAVQMDYITQKQDKNLVPALAAACAGIFLLCLNVSGYIFNNKKWVVEPALVADKNGARRFSYNPRIAILMRKIGAGTVFDREGLVLATSKPELVTKQKDNLSNAGAASDQLDKAINQHADRYYPFDDQLFFWTGDANTGIFDGGTNGYYADYEHAAELRGFNMPVSNYIVKASRYRENRFLPRGVKEMAVKKRDYRELAPLLLAGVNSAQTESFKKGNHDINLTIDAGLQTLIQKSIAGDEQWKNNRVSVVIMESATGDVLTSALYPLPPVHNSDLLTMSTTDQNKLASFVTTSDLGFTYATQPGSTAKLLTAMAALNKMGSRAADRQFNINAEERIRTGGPEPDETGQISMEQAIVRSNNVYFIKLANEEHLQDNMAELYLKTGMFLHGVGGYYYNKPASNSTQEEKWKDLWQRTEFDIRPKYNPANIRAGRSKGISGMAWGQGELIATPAAIARVAASVANKGVLMENRYVLKVHDSALAVKPGIKLANNPEYADLLKTYMTEQSANKTDVLGIAVAGKTGTPERIWKNAKINDGWYVFFAPSAKGQGSVVVCVRIEATKGSSSAVRLAGEHVIPYLLKMGYIKSIE
jgi:cell division protein FtsW (lipid II flippase)